MYRLIRKRDKLTKESTDVRFLEFGNDGKCKKGYYKPKVGRSLIMSPFNQSYTWMTTEITEILEKKDGYLRFKTKNSEYQLFRTKV